MLTLNYKLDEAQAIMSELRTIKKAIYTGEKERRDLMQVRGREPFRARICLLCSPCVSFLYLFISLFKHVHNARVI